MRGRFQWNQARRDGLLVSVLANRVPARDVQQIQRRWRRGHLGYTGRHRRR